MKKLTDKKVAQILGMTPQNVIFWKKNKPLQYEAVKSYYLLKENNFFQLYKKVVALISLFDDDCNSPYFSDLVQLLIDGDDVITEIVDKFMSLSFDDF